MLKDLFRTRTVALGVLITALAVAAPAQADTVSPPPEPAHIDWAALSMAVDTSWCSEPDFTQAFGQWHDNNQYVLAPGQSSDGFTGQGWVLTGGASVVTVTLADGSQTEALELPSGSTAVSPPMCVTHAYPTARAMVRDVQGGAGVQMFVVYTEDGQWRNPIATGSLHGHGNGWGASDVINIHAGKKYGWQEARFAFVGGGSNNLTDIYGFYVDPRMT